MTPFKAFQSNLFLNLLLVYILWGSTYLGVKLALIDFAPLFLTSIRFGIGGLILLVFTCSLHGVPSGKEIYGSAKVGFFLSGLGTSAVAFAIDYIPSGIVAVLVAILPLWTFILDFFFFSKKTPSKLSLLGMALGLVGVLFLFDPFGTEGKLNPLIVLLVMAGSVSWAYGSLISPSTKQTSGLRGVAVQMLAGGITALVFSFIFESNQLQQITNFTLGAALAIAYLIFLGSYVGYTSYVWLINNAPPLLVSSYAFVNPIVALILGALFANELLDGKTTLACLVILIGIVSMTLGRRKMPFEKKKSP